MSWKQNLALLHSRYPELARQIENDFSEKKSLQCKQHETGCWHIEQTPSGNPTLLYQKNPDTPKILIHSQRDPAREGQRQAGAAAAKTAGIIILLGFGLGYTAEALIQEHRTLIVVERHKELFTLAMKSRNLESLISQGSVTFVLGSGAAAINTALSFVEIQKPLIIKNRALTGITEEDESWYAGVERRINTWASKDEINAATLQRFGKRWTRNLAANIDGVLRFPGVKNLENVLQDSGIPVFLAAAGPSLNRVTKHLKEIRRRCVMVAVDTSLRFLLHNGIEPDFTVSVDPQYWNALHLYRLNAPNTALIAESAVYPTALRNFIFSRIFFCQSLFPLGRFIEDRTDPKGMLGAGGSVATTAWDFARFLGPPSIWMAGLDLAFPGYRTHYRGALFEENTHAVSGRFCPAETFSVASLENGIPFFAASASGDKVLTDKRLSLYAAWFENRMEQTGITSYSLSPDGIVIPGVVSAMPEELLSLPVLREKANQLFSSLYSRIDGEYCREQENRSSRYSIALSDLVRGLTTIRDQASAAKNIHVHKTQNPNETEKILKKLDKVNAAIAASPVKDAAGFLFPPVSELEKKQLETDPFMRHLEFSRLFYHSLSESADYTLKYIKKPLQRQHLV